MKDLKVLKKRRKEIMEKMKELEVELNDVEDKIARIEGTNKDLENIREDSENITKDIKKRPRPNYEENFNMEQAERNIKRQRRKKISPELIQKEGTVEKLDENYTVEKETVLQKENIELPVVINEEFNEENLDYKISNRRRQSKKEIEDLLEELPMEKIEELDIEKEGEIFGEISQLYFSVCEQEKIVFIGKRKMLEIYYEFGKKFEEKLDNLLNEVYNEKKTAITKIIDEIKEGKTNHSRESIRKRSEKARKIYLIISAAGGKEYINRLKCLNSEEYTKFSFKEIEEWIENH